jgi:hypothetical protein
VLSNGGSFYVQRREGEEEFKVIDIDGRVAVYLGGRRVQDSIVLKPAQEFRMKRSQYEVKDLDSTAFARKCSTRYPNFSFGWNLTEIMTYLKECYGLSNYSFSS